MFRCTDHEGSPVNVASRDPALTQYLLDLHKKRHEEEDECPEEIKLM